MLVLAALGITLLVTWFHANKAPSWEVHLAGPSPGYFNELNVATAPGELKFRAVFAHSYCNYDQNLFDPRVDVRGNVIRVSLLRPPEGTPICRCIFTTTVKGHVWDLASGEYNVEIGWRSRDGEFRKVRAVTVRVP